MKKRLLIAMSIGVFLMLAIFIYGKYISPTRIALISFPDFVLEKMERSNNNNWVKLSRIGLDELDKINKYDLILVRGHGVRISPEQLNTLRKASQKGCKIFVSDITNPEYDVTNLPGKELDYISDLLDNKCTANFQNLFNYTRKELDKKKFFTKPYSDAVILPEDFYFHINDDQVFGTFEEYKTYYKESGFYKEGAPRVALLAGNINIQNSNPEHTQKLIRGLEKEGLNVYPIRSFGEKKMQLLKICNPDLVILRPHGRLAMGQQDMAVDWLKEKNIPILAPLTVFDEYDKWLPNLQGMYGGMLSMSVVLPELDGAVAPYAIVAQFRGESGNLLFDAIPNRMENFCQMTANWLKLQQKKNAEKKVAIYYFKGPGQNALVASNMEVLPSLYNLLKSLKEKGYNVNGLPATEREFELLLMKKGPVLGSYALGTFNEFLKTGDPELVEKSRYEKWCKTDLPTDLYQQVADKYGEAPGRYMNVEKENKKYIAIARLQLGNVCLLPQPLPGVGEDTQKLVHGAKTAPPHTYIASYLWARHGFQADAIFHFGTHGSLEFTPGKQVALSDYDWPDRLIGNTPHFYIYTISNIGEGIIAKRRSYATLLTYLTPPFMKSGLHDELDELYQKLDKYNSLPSGPVKQQYAHSIKTLAENQNIHRTIGLDSTKNYTADDIHKIHEYLEEIEEEKVTAGLYTMGIPYSESKLKETVSLMTLDPVAFGLAELDGLRGKIQTKQAQDNLFVSEHYRPKARKAIQTVLNGGEEQAVLKTLLSAKEIEDAHEWEQQNRFHSQGAMMHPHGSSKAKGTDEKDLTDLVVELIEDEKNTRYIKNMESDKVFEKSSQMLDEKHRAEAVELAEKMTKTAPEMYEEVSIGNQEKMLELLKLMQDSIIRLKVLSLINDDSLKDRILAQKEQALKEKAQTASQPENIRLLEKVFSSAPETVSKTDDKSKLAEMAEILRFYKGNAECFPYCNNTVAEKLDHLSKHENWNSTLEKALNFINGRIDDIERKEELYANAVLKVENSILSIKKYYSELSGSPEAELIAIANALNGGYTAPSPGGDPVANPAALPTGRNMYSVNAEATPTEESWAVGKKLAESLLENEYKAKGSYPQKVSFTLWSTSFISTEGATIAQILYLLGVEPVRDGFGYVQNLRLIPEEELGRPRIDVVVQTSGQLRDLAASRLALIHKAVTMAGEANDADSLNYVRKGILEAEKYLLDKGFSPLDARKFSSNRVFGGINGNYGTGIMGLVEKGDAWDNEKQVASTYIHNMGAMYDDSENWGAFREGIFEAALQNAETVVQPRQSNTWGPLSLDHVYEFMGGMNMAVRNVTGKDPSAYFNDFRNENNPRMQELKEAIGVETNSTVFNPKFIKELLAGKASAMETFAETLRNTYGWNVMKPAAIDDYIWDSYHEIYVKDKYNLDVKKRFEEENPYALQEMASVMLETARKGYWKATDAQLKEIASLHVELIRNHKAGCSGFVCDNARLREFITARLEPEQAKQYQLDIEDVREVKLQENDKNVVLEKEQQKQNESDEQMVTEKKQGNNSIWVIAIVVLAGLVFFIVKTKKQNGKNE
ncbi:cobaltochelatase subunit CobN [Maribellus comscasis]|uniref:Cobaltochelatase subunit CobN n=1 Tax=Maribellus comscasis TaxID=2681766 RepID=A0A6I6K1T0_9BACT|nr:cobaltochelatase subunit CobN [Maribellus comscasis]QGY47599.1 cobaltochelatase subunit CobN [Maribellus comscasis]